MFIINQSREGVLFLTISVCKYIRKTDFRRRDPPRWASERSIHTCLRIFAHTMNKKYGVSQKGSVRAALRAAWRCNTVCVVLLVSVF